MTDDRYQRVQLTEIRILDILVKREITLFSLITQFTGYSKLSPLKNRYFFQSLNGSLSFYIERFCLHDMHKNGQPNQTHKLKRVSLTSKFGK